MVFIKSPDVNCPHTMMTSPGEEVPPILQAVKKDPHENYSN